MTLTVAVDGSALGNPGPAGWAWVISPDCWDSGGWDHGTNNLGELTAIQQILIATEAAGLTHEPLHLQADSQYAINVITKWMHGWKKRGWTKADKKPIANLELIQDIDRLITGRTVTFEWVRGHAGHPLNELADDKAREAATLHQNGTTAPGGPGLTTTPTQPHTTPTQPHTTHANTTLTVADTQQAQKALITAWLNNDNDTTTQWQHDTFTRIWPGGERTTNFNGPHPNNATIGHFHTTPAGTALIITYTLTWPTGTSTETSIWIPTEHGPRIIHHQSTTH